MKNRNPYLSCIILWIIVIFINLTACIFGVLKGVLWQAFFNLAIVMIDCIYLGWCICKFEQYRECENSAKEFYAYLQMLIDKEKAEENEPFKEFEENGESSSRKI